MYDFGYLQKIYKDLNFWKVVRFDLNPFKWQMLCWTLASNLNKLSEIPTQLRGSPDGASIRSESPLPQNEQNEIHDNLGLFSFWLKNFTCLLLFLG